MGNFAIIRDNATGMLTKYMHMQKRPTLHRGEAVSPDQALGKVGNTGFSTGAHLHFEVRDSEDRVVNPADFASTVAAQRVSSHEG